MDPEQMVLDLRRKQSQEIIDGAELAMKFHDAIVTGRGGAFAKTVRETLAGRGVCHKCKCFSCVCYLLD